MSGDILQRTAVFAHRGRAEEQEENTIPAFEAACRLGADGVELDVRLTRDHALVVHHDPDLKDAGLIADLDAADLPKEVPTLEQVLDVCSQVVVNIEVKSDRSPGEHPEGFSEEIADRTVQLLADRGRTDRVLISSFDLRALRAVGRADPTVKRGFLVSWTTDAGGALETAGKEGCTSLHPHLTQVTPALLEETHGAGLELHVWTVNSTDELHTLSDLGVDALITDRLVPALLATRGPEWRPTPLIENDGSP